MVELSSKSDLNNIREKVLAAAMMSPIIAVDTETNGKDIRSGEGYAIGISIAFRYRGEMFAAYYPIRHTKNNISEDMQERLAALLLSRTALVFHNAKFDLVSLETVGVNIRAHSIKWYCTMLMTHFMNENLMSKGLDYLSKTLLNNPGKLKGPDWKWAFEIYGWSADFPSEIMDRYATGDALDTYLLFEGGYPDFFKAGFDGNDPLYLHLVDTTHAK